jgi:hypothetical protein
VGSPKVLVVGIFSLLGESIECISSCIPLESPKLKIEDPEKWFATKALWASSGPCVVGGVIFRIEAGQRPTIGINQVVRRCCCWRAEQEGRRRRLAETASRDVRRVTGTGDDGDTAAYLSFTKPWRRRQPRSAEVAIGRDPRVNMDAIIQSALWQPLHSRGRPNFGACLRT